MTLDRVDVARRPNLSQMDYTYTDAIAPFQPQTEEQLLARIDNCFVIRRDLLKRFLEDKDYKLVWLLRASKELHGEDLSISDSSEWEGVYIFDEIGIEGDIKRMENAY